MRSTVCLIALIAISTLPSCAHSPTSAAPTFRAPVPAECRLECPAPPEPVSNPRMAIADLYRWGSACANQLTECVEALK